MMSFVYIQTEPRLWTVGCYDGGGQFQPESDHGTPGEAARHAAWLNGGPEPSPQSECQCARWTAAIARVAVLRSTDIHAGRQIQAAIDRGDSAEKLFYAGVQTGLTEVAAALRDPEQAGLQTYGGTEQ